MAAPTQPPHVRAWRQVLNEHWPDHPRDFKRRGDGIPVRVRIVFKDDGEAWLDGTAMRWDSEHVYVEINDRRLNTNGVWLKPHDVYRRHDTSMMAEK